MTHPKQNALHKPQYLDRLYPNIFECMVDHKISFNPLKKETCLYRWTQKLGVAATELGKTPSTTVRFRPFTPKRPTSEANRANSNALESYLDDMSAILLNENLEDEKIRTVAQARTVTIISELDAKRNNTVLKFLRDARMLDWVLANTDLSGADLSEANLSETNLGKTNLSRANLSNADLTGAVLSEANLTEANLFRASLRMANLSGATMDYANLTSARMSWTNLSGADMEGVNLKWVWMRDTTDLSNANFYHTKLEETYLGGVNLSKVNNLSAARFIGTEYNAHTIWPEEFNPKEAGAILVDDHGDPIEGGE